MAPRPKEKPIDPPSWWLEAKRENFTELASELFLKQRPPDTMSGVQFNWRYEHQANKDARDGYEL